MQRNIGTAQPARCARLCTSSGRKVAFAAQHPTSASTAHRRHSCPPRDFNAYTSSKSSFRAFSSSVSQPVRPQRQRRSVAARASLELARIEDQATLLVPPSTTGQVYASFRWPGQLGGSEVSVIGAWDDWETESCLFQAAGGGDWVRTLLIPRGDWEYKFKIDGKWRVAPSDPVIHNGQNNVNNKQLFTPNATIEVPARGQFSDVCVVGSWSNWRDIMFMERRGDRFVVDLCLHPGTYHYKLLRGSPEDVRQKGLDLWGGVVSGRAGELFALHEGAPTDQLQLADGRGVTVHKLECQRPLAFYLFYATGWTDCTLCYRIVDTDAMADDTPGEWQYLDMDDCPSRAQPAGPTSRWKQAFVPCTSRTQQLEFFVEGPPTSDSSGSDSDAERSRRNNGQRSKVARKEDRPYKGAADACYTLQWPGGWRLQKGRVTKFMRVMEPATLLCSDIDGTMVSDSQDEKERYWGLVRTQEFQTYWEDNAALAGGVLVYNTGRSKGQLVSLLGERPQLAVPDVCITAVGTKIWYLPEGKRAFSDPTQVEWIEDKSWAKELDQDWDLNKVRSAAEDVMNRLNSGAASPRVQWLDQGREHPHRIALSCQLSALQEVTQRLADTITNRGVLSRIITSGSGDWRYVDVVAVRAGKLEALEWVRKLYNIPVERCATAGDSCNDILMLDGRMPAIIVGNAQAELVDWYHRQNDAGRIVLTHKSDAAGVLEGLARHRLI